MNDSLPPASASTNAVALAPGFVPHLAPDLVPDHVAASANRSAPLEVELARAMNPASRGVPNLKFLVTHPAHFLALGFGSGLPRVAPGTWGTLFAWASYVVLSPYAGDRIWLLIAAALVLGVWAAEETGRHLGQADSGHIVIDEIAAFWIVLAMLPGSDAWLQFAAFLLFRAFDITKPPPIRGLDARMKNGVGVMLDDLVAAFYALLVMALALRVSEVFR